MIDPETDATAPPLEAVQLDGWANGEESRSSHRLHMPEDVTPEAALQRVRREALRWTYLLRSRKRWVADLRARERNEVEAREALGSIGLGPAGQQALAGGSLVVVRIPWTGDEAMHWESRVFPWEYVLSAATRSARLGRSSDGRTPQLTVMRELQRQAGADATGGPACLPPVAVAPDADASPRILFVECVPSELARQWSVTDERERLAQVLPGGTEWITLRHPTPGQLFEALRRHAPQMVHFAGLDSHQALRELRLHFGASAQVGVDRGARWLRPFEHPGGAAPPAAPAADDGLQLVDDVLADASLLLDGVLLRHVDGLPLLVRAHDLARLMKAAGRPVWFASFNVWNSAARLAALLVAEGAATAALGFQDAFEDSLADFVHATMYRQLVEKGWNLPQAFIETWAQVRRLPETVNATGITLWTGAPVLPLRDAPPPHPRRPIPSDEIRCLVTPWPELNYAVLHNAQPLFEAFVLECDLPGPDRTADVEVAVHMGSETASFRRRITMDRPRVSLTRDVHVPLTSDVARTVHEAISTSLTVHVQSDDRTLHCDSHRLRLLPVDQWRDNRRDGRWLPSFVQPRDPAVLRAVELAQRYNRVLRDDPRAGFEGYQAALFDDEESLRSVDRQVEAIWAVLLHDWQLAYLNPPPAYSGGLDSQRLRTPSMVREHRCGTCIDLALLFAACLELIDIYPVIFLLEGHALPGWWRHPDFRDEYAAMSDRRLADVVTADESENGVAGVQLVAWHTGKASHAEVQRWIRQRKLVPIETVRLTENCGFVEAIEAGVSALASHADFDSMLELVTARQEQVTPLPMLGDA